MCGDFFAITPLFVSTHWALLNPSGEPLPSDCDRSVTCNLREAGALLGIKVLDHVVLGEDRIYSFAEHGE